MAQILIKGFMRPIMKLVFGVLILIFLLKKLLLIMILDHFGQFNHQPPAIFKGFLRCPCHIRGSVCVYGHILKLSVLLHLIAIHETVAFRHYK